MNPSHDPGQQLYEQVSAELTALERVLETPLVPGELAVWATTAQEAVGRLDSIVQSRFAAEHPKLLTAIEWQDMELASRIERLRDEDGAILQAFKHFQYEVNELAGAADSIEPREDRVHDHFEDLINDGIQLILRMRRQEVAIDNWFMEALFRDRGVND